MTLFAEIRHEPDGRQITVLTDDGQTRTVPVKCDYWIEYNGEARSMCDNIAVLFAGGFEDEAACLDHANWIRSL